MEAHDYPGAEQDDAHDFDDSHADYYYDSGFDDVPDTDELHGADEAADSVAADEHAANPFWRRVFDGVHARLRWSLYLLAFMIPIALLAIVLGVTALRNDDSGTSGASLVLTATPVQIATVVGEWPPDVVFTPHTVPAMIRDEVAFSGAQNGYRFNGGAGQIWLIEVAPTQNGLDPQITLYAPSGAGLAINDNRAAGDVTAELLVLLPESGAYRLLVEGAGNTTGSYLLELYVQE